MTYTGPEKYPGASLAYFWQDSFGGDRMETNVCLWHTTEGRTLDSYQSGAVAPNLTVLPLIAQKTVKWYQHFDIDCSSRALVNQAGGVQTNTLNVVQIELIGTCDPAHRTSWGTAKAGVDYIYWPEAPDWLLAELGKFARWLQDNHGVPLKSTVTFKAYPGSYGADNGVRLTGAQWLAYTGHLGHQHAPENFHGDPGNLDIQKILAFAAGTEADMPLTNADIKALFNTDDIVRSPDDSTDTNKFWTLGSYLRETYLRARSAQTSGDAATAAVADVKKDVAALSKKVDTLATGGVDLDALAKKVADLLAARLKD